MEDEKTGPLVDSWVKEVAKLAPVIGESIKNYKANGGKNENAFSVKAAYKDGKYNAECAFKEDPTMTIFYKKNQDNEIVASLYDFQIELELEKRAHDLLVKRIEGAPLT